MIGGIEINPGAEIIEYGLFHYFRARRRWGNAAWLGSVLGYRDFHGNDGNGVGRRGRCVSQRRGLLTFARTVIPIASISSTALISISPIIAAAAVVSFASVAIPTAPVVARLRFEIIFVITSGFRVIFQQMLIINRVHIRDVQEAVATDPEVDERGLNARFDVDDSAFVDVVDVAFLAGPLEVKFFEHAVFQYGDTALLRLEDVD
jgi:hypothetical protein